MAYARGTEVPVSKSQQDIKHALQAAGADDIVLGESMAQGLAFIQFRHKGLPCQIRVKLPSAQERRFRFTEAKGLLRSADQAAAAWRNECKRKWRVALLLIKAQLEAIAEGITTPEEALLPWLLLSNGHTVGETVAGRAEQFLASPRAGALLLEGPES
jgi:hypothetical protein